ncbi:TPA: hypothetical protein V0P88_001498 [Streptococcus pneumoniae]|nr:hypothetical protein [Streptococcus pneumoniae]HEW2727792.1 hypothetical protein [Streptococcus pneumoniae]
MVEFIKSKKEMSEEDIKANFITPAIVSKGWKNGEHIAYEEYFTDGRIEVRGDKARLLPVIVHHKIQYLQYFPLGNLGRNILPLDQGFKNRQAQTKQSPSSFIEII